MKTKKVLLIVIPIIVLLLVRGFIYYKKVYKVPDKEPVKVEKKEEIVSTIIIDINPSIKIDLDKDNNVIKVTPLNEDAKKIIDKDYNGEKLDIVFNEIRDNSIKEGLLKDDTSIILTITGEIKVEDVKNKIETSFKEKEFNCEILIPVVDDTSKEIAEKYNISEGKAAYLESVLEENKDLKIEEIKDKSVSELKVLKEKKEETTTKKSNSNSSNNNISSGGYSGGCTPPSDLKSKDWCTFNTKRPQSCEYYYPEMANTDGVIDMLLEKNGISPYEATERYHTNAATSSSSYCIAVKAVVADKDYKYTYLLDSVTLEIISEVKEAVPKPTMTEDEAKQKGLAYYGLNEEDCRVCWVVYGVDKSGGPDEYYRYQVNMDMLDGNCYSIDYNSVTGEVVSTRTWRNE